LRLPQGGGRAWVASRERKPSPRKDKQRLRVFGFV
jgi:hypothetical protein